MSTPTGPPTPDPEPPPPTTPGPSAPELDTPERAPAIPHDPRASGAEEVERQAPGPAGSAGPEVRLEAYASGDARIHQAARDQHFHYGEAGDARRRAAAGGTVAECPYPGLAAFGPDQARWFFGRDGLIADLVARLDRRLGDGGIQMVVAPSGAGKSSLLRAGLLPRLEQGTLPGSHRWPRMLFTPTATPLRALAVQLCALTRDDPGQVAAELRTAPGRGAAMLRARATGPDDRVAVVVDQFEELFTLCADDEERRAFIDALAHLAGPGQDGSAEPPPAVVVAGIRGDFYSACAGYPRMRSALEGGPLVFGAMSAAEIREAITHPARDVGLDIEPGLVELLLRDLGVTGGTGERGAAYEAGRLPLLAHALRATWQQRHGSTLTVEGYRLTGGIQRAVATTADSAFSLLDSTGQRVARASFLRLVRIGEASDDTRRRLSRDELVGASADPATAAAVVDAFARARLLSLHEGTVEITHEALLRSWPRLRRWIDDDRTGRLTHQDLEDAALDWERGGRDPSLPFRGNRLAVTRAWAATAPPEELSPAARAFLAAGVHQEGRAARLRTGVIAVLTVLAVVAATGAVYAFQTRAEALRQRDLAVYNRVLAEADRAAPADVSLAARLTLVAHRMRPGDETYTRLLALGQAALSTTLDEPTAPVASVAVSARRGLLAAVGKDERLWLWDIADPARPRLAGQAPTDTDPRTYAELRTVAFRPDGRLLAVAGHDAEVRLWDVADPARPVPLERRLPQGDIVHALAFSPDGHTLAVAGNDGTIPLWDLTDPARPEPLGAPLRHPGAVLSVAFRPDGRLLAGAGNDGTVLLWHTADPARPVLAGPGVRRNTSITSVAFSPDGRTLAGGGADHAVHLWDVKDPGRPWPAAQSFSGHTDGVNAVAFSPDGRTLATASGDRTVRLWNVAEPFDPSLGQPLTGHTDHVSGLAFGADGRTLVSGGEDGTVRLWNLPSAHVTGADARAVAFAPDGRALAVAAGGAVELWDADAPGRAPLGRIAAPDEVTALAFGPDRRTLAGTGDGSTEGKESMWLWDATDPARPRALNRPRLKGLNGHGSYYTVAVRPDGRVAANADGYGRLWLWDITDPARPKVLGRPLSNGGSTVASVAFSPDGHTVAAANSDGVRLWDVRDPARGRLIGRPFRDTVNAVAFSPDGRTLAGGGQERTVMLSDVTDPARPRELGEPLTGHTGSVDVVAFAPGGRTLATGGGVGDGTVRLWDLTDRAKARPLGGPLTAHAGPVLAMAFSPGGRVLVTSGMEGTVRFWPLDERVSVRRICAVTGSALSKAEWRRHVGDEIPYSAPCP
ncbi:nSTAND1 domain-containing NTPase [Sphaerisporangium aureirubrum]|uniref:Novel STAND NTPase 1 domain-containing protein n=1 Tax=Sphaerisporangium aureirubrum TaxID=1544736 RepID=A0ABW1NGR6_9ACTN